MADLDLYDVIVIGGGAAGMMAAVTAARTGSRVLLLEKTKRAGQKLLLTGSGRCNLTNLDPALPYAYRSSDMESLNRITESVFGSFSTADTLAFFDGIGLKTHARGSLVYPHSDQASSVLHCLEKELRVQHVRQKNMTAVTALKQKPYTREGAEASSIWEVSVDGWSYCGRTVILCTGSKAVPETGCDGSGYALAAMTGHPVETVLPALCGLMIKEPVRLAAGARTDAAVRLTADGRTYTSSGQVQWGKDHLSGICIMDLSVYASRALQKGDTAPVKLQLDLAPDMTEEELTEFLNQQLLRSTSSSLQELLEGLLPDKAAGLLAKTLPGGLPLEQTAEYTAHLLKNLTFTVVGTRSFANAQVCTGGISLACIDPRTMESRIREGLFFAGEILDIDGPCGGYNLQWAWSSGHTAGAAAARQAAAAKVSKDRNRESIQ